MPKACAFSAVMVSLNPVHKIMGRYGRMQRKAWAKASPVNCGIV